MAKSDAILPSEILVLGAIFIGAKHVLSAEAQALGDPGSAVGLT
jgi:hypothetical protein